MIEIIFILLSYITFLLLALIPLNINSESISYAKINLDKIIYNLTINLSLLFILSLLPTNIKYYTPIFIITYLLLFFYKSILINFSFKKIINILLFFYIPGIVFICFALVIANKLYLGWDAKYFYYIKSLFFFNGFSLEDLNNFSENKWHPHLGSFYWAFFWNLFPIKIEYFGRLFYLFIYCISIFYITNKIFNKKSISNILYIIILLALFNYERFSGLQEILIFSLLIILSYFFFNSYSNNKIYILFTILISNLILWIKSEGIVYFLIILTCILIGRSISKKFKIITLIFFICAIVLKYIIYYKYNFIYNAQPYNFNYIFSLNFETVINKLKYIIPYLIYYSLKNYIFFLGIVILIYLNLYKNHEKYLRSFNTFAILNIFFIVFAYLIRETEVLYSIKTTMDRVVFASSGFYLVLLLITIKQIITKFKNGTYIKLFNKYYR